MELTDLIFRSILTDYNYFRIFLTLQKDEDDLKINAPYKCLSYVFLPLSLRRFFGVYFSESYLDKDTYRVSCPSDN